MSNSIANKKEVIKLATELGRDIPSVARDGSSRAWTQAVWECFRNIGKNRSWLLYPDNQPYSGEFLVDFVLWDTNYGPRVVCESQWQHRFSGIDAIDWAFDKLRCVKGDIKVLLYEWSEPSTGAAPPKKVADILERYLKQMELFSTDEAFLFMNFSKGVPWAHWWKPEQSGIPEHIDFKKIDLPNTPQQ